MAKNFMWVIKMSKKIMAALMAAGIMFSFAACNLAGKPSETTAEETTTTEETTTEETTTSEETTTEETTSEETTVSEETTTVVETTAESTTATTKAAPADKATKKKAATPSVPKGYKKVYWNKKFQGHKVYLILKQSKGKLIYKGWWKNKWVDLWYDEAGDDYQGWQIKDSKHTIYYEVGN